MKVLAPSSHAAEEQKDFASGDPVIRTGKRAGQVLHCNILKGREHVETQCKMD